MAFSTQKDFFNVPFMNESYKLDCKKACVKLKRYESTVDTRSWANDEAKQSKFLSDLVTCQYQVGDSEADLSSGGQNLSIAEKTPDFNASKGGDAVSEYSGKTPSKKQSEYDVAANAGNEEVLLLQAGGDSLLECANVHLAEYHKVLQVKTSLEKQLEVSNERLKTASEENKQIREILSSKLDNNATKDFYNKIQKFTTAGKFSKNEENEMLQIYQKMENMNKAYEILQAENNYLKRLIDKLSTRITLENITTTPETSTDVDYLQKEINTLRKECLLLRQIEDDYLKSKQQQPNSLPSISEQDAENIKAIIKERNSLREKCKSFKVLQQEMKELEYKTHEAKKEALDLCTSLKNKTEYINEMEREMQNMQKYYEEKIHSASLREECLKAQLDDLKDEVIKAKCEAQKADILAMEVSSLRNEVLKRDLSLNDYDCQYKQLMDVVNELQSVKLQSLNDNQTQTCKDQIDELTFYTCATLNEIVRELKKKGCFGEEFMAAYGQRPASGGSGIEYDRECRQEVKRLQQQVDRMKREFQQTANGEGSRPEVYDLTPAPKDGNIEYDEECQQKLKRLQERFDVMRKGVLDSSNCDVICADALQHLKKLESENAKLSQDNQALTEKLKERDEKISGILKKVEYLEREIKRSSQEAVEISKDLQGTISLVKDISEVQSRNQQLVNAVSAINSRDDEKIIEDLRRQLEEEMNKLKKCQHDNANLINDSKNHDKDLKALKDINSKLQHDNFNLRKKLRFFQPEEFDEHGFDMIDESRYEEVEENILEYEENPDQLQGSKTMQPLANTSHYNSKEGNLEISNKQNNNAEDAHQKAADKNLDQQKTSDLEQLESSPSKHDSEKQPRQDQLKAADLGAPKDQPRQDEPEASNLDELEPSLSKSPSKEHPVPGARYSESKQPSQAEGRTSDLGRLESSASKSALNDQPREDEPEASNLDELEPSLSKSPSKEHAIPAARYSKKKQPSQAEGNASDLGRLESSPSKHDSEKQPGQDEPKASDLEELELSPSKSAPNSKMRQPRQADVSASNQIEQNVSDLDELEPSSYINASKKQTSQARPNEPISRQPKHLQQGSKASSSANAEIKQAKRSQQKAKVLREYDTSPHRTITTKQLSHDQQKDAALDDFVAKKSDSLKVNLLRSRCFEKEFRSILEEFILECSICFCRLFNTKSKLYTICHRLCHKGIDTLNFRELAYLHRKIYAQADQLLPGCLLDMILSDHKEEVVRMLTSDKMTHLEDSKKNDSNIDLKCCSCKSELCCNNSEELLKEKVTKLEKDIEIAREYLETLRNIPLEANACIEHGNSSDTNNSTYRASSPVIMQKKSLYSKHIKKLKNRSKHPAI